MISAASSWKLLGHSSSLRRPVLAVLLLASAAIPGLAQPRVNQEPPQRGGQPRQDTPYIIIATFRSDSRQLGVEASDEVRKRVASEHSAQELFVVTKHNINVTLGASGYSPDSALSPMDLMELSRQLHGEYVLDATVTKSGAAVRVDPRLMMRTGTTTMTQPLPTVNGKDAGDAAKIVERELADAIKGMPPYRLCIADLRAQKWDQAAKDAAAGILAYPNSTLSRVCLLNAVTASKGSPDSVIAVANGILALDSANVLALGNLFEALVAKGDTKKAIEIGTKLLALDPNNHALTARMIQLAVTDNRPQDALGLIDAQLKDNPGDPELLTTKWKVLLAASRFKEAIVAGEELAKVDPAQVTVDYYNRMIGAAQKGDSGSVVRLAEAAAQKFPKEPSFINLVTQSYFKSGQLPKALEWARKASQIDPKNPTPWQFILAVQNQMHQPDSMIASARDAIKAGVPKDSIGVALLAVAGPALKKAQDSHLRADWEDALKASQVVDEIASSPQSKFYVGVSALSIGADAVQNIQKLYNNGHPAKGDAAKACDEIKIAEDNFAIATVNVPAGGRYDPATAGTIMGNLGSYTQFESQVKTALHCK